MYWTHMTANDDKCCPNCGSDEYHKNECDKCGYIKPERKSLSEAALIYCNLCGCTYLTETGICSKHGIDSVQKVKV